MSAGKAGVHRGSRGAGPPGGGQGAMPPEAEAFSIFAIKKVMFLEALNKKLVV